MGIRYSFVPPLALALQRAGDLTVKSLLTLGVQDCNFDYPGICGFLQRHGIQHQSLPAASIRSTTGFKGSHRPIEHTYIHQDTFFQLLGFSPDNIRSLDYSDYEGPNFVHDLNEPVPESLAGRFDIVFDGGTTEHVFSLKDALCNVARLLKTGGMAIHINPLDYVNHGFVNYNPTLLRDFYLGNGFEEIDVQLISMPTVSRLRDRHCLYTKPEDFYFTLLPHYETVIFAAFQKSGSSTLNVVQQGLYRRIWDDRPGSRPPASKSLKSVLFNGLLDASSVNMYLSSVVRIWATRRRARRLAL